MSFYKLFLSQIILALVLAQSCDKPDPFQYTDAYEHSIMSFNLRFDTTEDGPNQWENRKEACIRMLNKTKPSVFGIQEGLHHQVNYLNTQLEHYDYVGVGRDDGHSAGEYSAIFYDNTKLRVLEHGDFWLSETPEIPSKGWDANNIRIASWAQFEDLTTQKTFFVFNTHFDHKGKTARKESAKLILQRINTLCPTEATVFITGDFNALIRNPIFDPILDQFQDAKRMATYSDNEKSFNAFGRWYLNRNIDFIFFKNAQALAYRTVKEDYGVQYISDHYPVMAFFNLSTQN